MKVDMSPEAITGRLRAMEQLWVLSVKLMQSDSVKKSRPSRAIEIYDSVRQILLRDWDPIGVCGEPNASDEYDAYIAPIYRILVGTRSEFELIECLRRIERDEIGLSPGKPESLKLVAENLLALDVKLN